jgi:hypothetical protein
MTKYLSRDQAAEYLLERFGAPIAVSRKTLAKMAVVGGGPKFRKAGRFAAYDPVDLDDWALNRLSSPKSEGRSLPSSRFLWRATKRLGRLICEWPLPSPRS